MICPSWHGHAVPANANAVVTHARGVPPAFTKPVFAARMSFNRITAANGFAIARDATTMTKPLVSSAKPNRANAAKPNAKKTKSVAKALAWKRISIDRQNVQPLTVFLNYVVLSK